MTDDNIETVDLKQLCAKCGAETQGEAAFVDGKVWCHPCADEPLRCEP